MADLTLALDIGANSIGWALVDEQGEQIIEAGVRVFPAGVERSAAGAETSKNATRREARAARRVTARRARRRKQLRKLLSENGLLPAKGIERRNDSDHLAQLWAKDPYALRARAVHEQLELFEIGRVLVHLNQRRGFLSNRKTDRDPESRKENEGLLAEIEGLEKELKGRTLGEFLAELRGSDPKKFHRVKLRGRHTHRHMYQQELRRIWDTQRQFYPEILTDELREKIEGIIFFQRDIHPPGPSLIGHCELEPRLPRAARADRRYQRFRMYQQVNNLRVTEGNRPERPLSDEERTELIRYLSGSKDRKFDDIRKHKPLFEIPDQVRFNLERGDRKRLQGMASDAAMASRKVFGKKWHALAEDVKDHIVAAMIDADEQHLRELLDRADLDPDLADWLLDTVHFEQGYGSYSIHAIKRLLPFVEQGLPLTSREPSQPCALREAGYLMPWEQAIDHEMLLPKPPRITNPLVQQALHEVRKVVNGVLREFVYRPGHRLANIRIELARDVRGTAEQRRVQTKRMRYQEFRRREAAEKLDELRVKPTRSSVNRYLLWSEQDGVCPYSGQVIGLEMLFSGEVDVDHILPKKRSLDDSMMNKVVCLKSENSQGVNPRAKGNRTPHEWLADRDPEKFEKVMQRARKLPYPKYQRFLRESVDLGLVRK